MQKKNKIGLRVLRGTCKWSADFQLKRSKVKVTGCETSKIWRHVTGGSAGGSSTAGADYKLDVRHY